MSASNTRDMTEGSPARHIIGFFFPLLFGLVFQQFYNMADSVIVGRFLGVKALAGVGSTGSLNFLVLGFCIGVCNGFVIPVSQKFGERDFIGLKRYVTNAITLSVVFSAVLTVLVCALCGVILRWMSTPEDIFAFAYDYVFVMFLGIPVMMLYNVLFGIIRSMGDSRTPVLYLVFCSLLNVLLDLLFILVFKTGVAGAAWATVLAQALSALLCVNYIRRSDALIFDKDDWKPRAKLIKQLLAMGLPMGLQYSITAIGSIIMQAAVNSLGSVYVAAVAAGVKINQLVSSPFDAMGSTMVTYAGQNIGARKLRRISEGVKSCSLLAIGYSVLAWSACFFGGGLLSRMFVESGETEVLMYSHMFLKYISAFFIPLAFVNILRLTIQGMGFTKLAMLAGVCEMIARAAMGAVFTPMFGYVAICLAHPSAWVAADMYLVPMYFHVMKKLKAKFAAEDMPAQA